MNESELITSMYGDGESIEDMAFLLGVPVHIVRHVILKSCMSGELAELYVDNQHQQQSTKVNN